MARSGRGRWKGKRMTRSELQRDRLYLSETYLWSRCSLNECGCRLWQGAKDRKGYGVLRVGHKVHRVHRVAYALRHKAVPAGMTVHHTCGSSSCCNPEHLTLREHHYNSWNYRYEYCPGEDTGTYPSEEVPF